jgi:adenosine kinase
MDRSYEELCSNYDAEYIPGGATQNGIRVCQWILQDVPRACTFIGCVGNDDYARRMKERAEKDLVRPQYMVDATTPTGTCAVLVNGPHRSLVANLAAANNYKACAHRRCCDAWHGYKSRHSFVCPCTHW